MSGYGESGPYVDRPGQDLLLQALSGAMLSAGRASDPPQPAGQFLADAITTYTAIEGAPAEPLPHERTGDRQLVQVNMHDRMAGVELQDSTVITVDVHPHSPPPTTNPHPH